MLMTNTDLNESKLTLPTYIVAIIISVFMSLIGVVYMDLVKRLDRIENKLDSHILLSNTINK
jgi:H+/Cl- antiporter ClcA